MHLLSFVLLVLWLSFMSVRKNRVLVAKSFVFQIVHSCFAFMLLLVLFKVLHPWTDRVAGCCVFCAFVGYIDCVLVFGVVTCHQELTCPG